MRVHGRWQIVAMLLATLGTVGTAHGASLTRTSGFDYDTSGLLKKEIVEGKRAVPAK